MGKNKIHTPHFRHGIFTFIWQIVFRWIPSRYLCQSENENKRDLWVLCRFVVSAEWSFSHLVIDAKGRQFWCNCQRQTEVGNYAKEFYEVFPVRSIPNKNSLAMRNLELSEQKMTNWWTHPSRIQLIFDFLCSVHTFTWIVCAVFGGRLLARFCSRSDHARVTFPVCLITTWSG